MESRPLFYDMTICISLGDMETQLRRKFFLGQVTMKVRLNITWVSCGLYQIRATKLEEAEPSIPIMEIHLTPEWVDKVAELYPSAPKRARGECYKPFYEDYLADPGMFDMGHDTLFQAFKDQFEDRVIMTNYHFEAGVPRSVDVLDLAFEEFSKLKEFLNAKKGEIFYSGVTFA